VSPLKVICPKCFKEQQVVAAVPPIGVDHVCTFCRTPFKVKPPARPPLDDLPVPREAMPRPDDLPVDRDMVPRPGDLPVSRETMPRPGDLPVSREIVPRPGDLPVAKGPSFGPNLPASSSERAPARTSTPPLGLGLDLFADEDMGFGAASGAPSAPLDLAIPPPPPPPEDPLGFSLEAPPLPDPPHAKAPPSSPRKPPPLPGRAAGGEPQPHARANTMPFPMPAVPVAPSSTSRQASPSLSDLLDEAMPTPPDGVGGRDGSPLPVARITPEKKASPASRVDMGFSLELEGETQPGAPNEDAIPFPGVRVARVARMADEGMVEAAPPPPDDKSLPSLAPPTSRGTTAVRALRPSAKRKTLPRWIFFAGSAVVAALLGVVVGLPLLRTAPSPDTVIAPFSSELAKDNLTAYAHAADRLTQAGAKTREQGAKLRIKAAELLLLAFTVHGGAPSDLDRAEHLLDGIHPEPKVAASLGLARALLAVAKGKPREADALLADRNAETSLLILGIARLSEDKSAAAVAPLRRYVAAKPAEALGHYLLGKALAATTSAEARKEFEAALARNPTHAGAQIALAQFEDDPDKRLAAARALLDKNDKKSPEAGIAEQAELQLMIGQAAQALGRTLEAIDAFQRAVTLDRRLTAAHLALGESLLYEGKYAEALDRLKGAGPGLEASAAGKFCLGGALIATGKAAEGLTLIEAATKERPEDPRGPFWTGFAAAAKQPPDFAAGEQGYRGAIKRDPKFLPASLTLAALLQQQHKAEESLAVLRAAEEAGAPASVLQLAWGEALIVAGEPVKAEEVFTRALDADSKSIAARLGLASALEAQGKLAEARASLEETLKSSPQTLGLRERLAEVCLKLGHKDEALARYQDELQTGHATRALHLAIARLALDLGKFELAQSEVKKVGDESPRNAEAAFLIARVHELRGETGAALQDYRHATTWGNTPEYALGYGRLLEKIGKENEALLALADATPLAAGRMERGLIYFRAGDLENALVDFQAASRMNPNQAEPLILQGLCYDKTGQSAKAEEVWRLALKVDPDAAEPHYRIGRADMDRAKPAAAVDHFRKAMAKAPDDAPWRADLQFQLAQAELLVGSKPAALAAFKKYLAMAPADAPARPEAAAQVARLGGGKNRR
jgi:tetratricopeptide (TPR) repeat protein